MKKRQASLTEYLAVKTSGTMKLIAVATLLVSMAAGCSTERASARRQAYERSLGGPNGPLNPNGFPQLRICESVRLDDPAAEAQANVAKGDLRPFAVFGFIRLRTAPGIVCPRRSGWAYDYRGGTLVSDRPECGRFGPVSNAPPEKMEAYNRALAADRRFQKLTGCKPAKPLK